MQATTFIHHKRLGKRHSLEELEDFIGGYVQGTIPDYQVAAWLMAVCWQGMTAEETADLTQVMAASGDVLDLSSLSHSVDKHSTGGVGDKTTLVLAPLLASCGASVAKMSGRGLGHTGGTIDKLEALSGFEAVLDETRFFAQARDVGIAITGQSKNLAPADGLLYAMRDATATVQSLPLIASSIMSKKLAGGAQSIVLDVKVGSGAFMKTLAEATALANLMMAIGQHAGRQVRVVLSNMAEPLGFAVGNSLEVREAIACLRGEGPQDLEQLCLRLAEEVLAASGIALTSEEIRQKLYDGEAFKTFQTWIARQGATQDSLERLDISPDCHMIYPRQKGFLAGLDALAVGRAVSLLGGGRATKESSIDLGVGVVLHKKIADEVNPSQPLLALYHRGGRGLEEATQLLEQAVQLSSEAVTAPQLIFDSLS